SDSTTGETAKLYSGVGLGIIHSTVRASQGSRPEGSPWVFERHQLYMKNRIDRAMVNAPIVSIWFQVSRPASAGYFHVRRTIPCRPSQCIGANVMFMPMNMSQK